MRNRLPSFVHLNLIVWTIFLASCAQIVAPDGGEKDRQPPRPIAYTPDSAATNVSGKKIVIRFDEYIQLQNVSDQVVISPPLNTPPEISIRKKEIVIQIRDTLRANTTYTINFGSAIRDITENNKLENFTYVFSTGPTIDTMHVSGVVRNAFTLAPEKNVYVMLYEGTSDSAPIKSRPYYFTKTREDGSFRLSNLRTGTYRIFGLVDVNANYLFDNNEERIAFSNEPVVLNNSVDTLSLRLFQEEPRKTALKKTSQPWPNRIVFEWNRPDKNANVEFITPIPPDVKTWIEKSKTNDSVTVFLSKIFADTLRARIVANNVVIDSTEIQLLDPNDKRFKARAGVLESRKLHLTSPANSSKAFDLGDTLQVYANNPISTFDTKRIFLIRRHDTLAIKPELDQITRRKLILPIVLEEDSSYQLFIAPGALVDWFGQKNDTLKRSFVVQRSGYYGNLSVKITGIVVGRPYMVQLLNERGQVLAVQRINKEEKLVFNRLQPGTYALRLIDDVNGNGRWDTGNYTQGLQPERVRIYSGAIKVRSGWDLDIDWKLF